MIAADVIAALSLPFECRVDQRVPKKLLIENGAPTAGDRRQINEGIEELLWLAALKPNTIGVPSYRDDIREVVEIAVLSLVLRSSAKCPRLVELIHRAIPYPVLLLSAQAETVAISVANKRFSQNEAGKVVLDDTVTVCTLVAHPETPKLLKSLALASQPRAHLFAFYQGWLACLEAFQAAQITGLLVLPSNTASQEARRRALAEYARLEREIAVLRAQAEKEKQLNRRVELNLELKRLATELAATSQLLTQNSA